MPESKDPAIKLFGMKIPLPADSETQPIRLDDSTPHAIQEKQSESDEEAVGTPDKESTSRKADDTAMEQKDDPPDNSNDNNNSEPLAEADPNPRTNEQTAEGEKSSMTKKEQNDAVNSQEKPLKKPDSILPCPRCNSMDTKFCYYNNYNVNQPRHFCKACQRYWTAGGTMRNVPVGAGRRKNKYSASHYRHITISEALQAARIDASDGTHLPALKNNVRVLSFGLDAPICDSMVSILNLTDKKVPNGTRNGFHSIGEQSIPVPCKSKESGDDCSSTSSVTATTSMEDVGKRHSLQSSLPAINRFPAQIPCLPGIPWPYPWSSTAPPPAFCPAGFPLPFYAAPLPNCIVPCNWSIPWFSPQPSSPSQMSTSSPNSPTLGKHSRDWDILKSHILEQDESLKQKNGCVLVPKTLRIDDPCEAAKSSIWATLGIKNEAAGGGVMFKAFQPKNDEKNHNVEASPVLRTNPAALSRSLNFHERS